MTLEGGKVELSTLSQGATFVADDLAVYEKGPTDGDGRVTCMNLATGVVGNPFGTQMVVPAAYKAVPVAPG